MPDVPTVHKLEVIFDYQTGKLTISLPLNVIVAVGMAKYAEEAAMLNLRGAMVKGAAAAHPLLIPKRELGD